MLSASFVPFSVSSLSVPTSVAAYATPPTMTRAANIAASTISSLLLILTSRRPHSGRQDEADLERMAERFIVELGWLQERVFPPDIAHPRATLSAQDLLELADDYYRFRARSWAWPMG